jgi:NMD protein affecting ribosome stability and mRNA decay
MARALHSLVHMGKALIRSQTRGQVGTGKRKLVEGRRGRLPEPSACERCGAVFSRRVWHRPAAVGHALLARVRWTTCPACEEAKHEEYHGRVLIRGDAGRTHEALIRRRIANVVERAGSTQPERRLVSMERRGDTLEVLTSSQKLAHRIVHELKKLLGGRATYSWSEDRSLFATWSPRERTSHRP